MEESVCCMCGDVGLPDKLIRCFKCRHRQQHSYCSNFYVESKEPSPLCDWCRSEEKDAGNSGSGRGMMSRGGGDRIKQHQGEIGDTGEDNNKGKGGLRRPTARKYKLLKDLMR